jgi:hypothetical protein
MLLARDGHEVTLFERDAAPVPDSPDDAWATWERKGVAQFRQPHFLQARVRHVLDAELPDVRDGLVAAEAVVVDPMERLPPAIADRQPRPGDDRWISLSARRPTTELAFARAAASQPGLEVHRGIVVEGLETRARNGSVHVTGVRTDAGDVAEADLVVDAMGRRSPLPRWLRDAGAGPIQEESEDCGFVYYTRYFRALDGACPEPCTGTLLTPIGSFSILTLPSDRRTWGVTIYPSLGRGLALGLAHSARLRDVVSEHLDDPVALAAAWDAVTEAEFTPWYRATVAVDRARLAEIDAIRDGAPPPAPPRGAAAVGARLPVAARYDADVFRGLLDIVGCLTLPQDVFARPGLADRILAASDGVDATPPPGPSRDDLLHLVA